MYGRSLVQNHAWGAIHTARVAVPITTPLTNIALEVSDIVLGVTVLEPARGDHSTTSGHSYLSMFIAARNPSRQVTRTGSR